MDLQISVPAHRNADFDELGPGTLAIFHRNEMHLLTDAGRDIGA